MEWIGGTHLTYLTLNRSQSQQTFEQLEMVSPTSQKHFPLRSRSIGVRECTCSQCLCTVNRIKYANVLSIARQIGEYSLVFFCSQNHFVPWISKIVVFCSLVHVRSFAKMVCPLIQSGGSSLSWIELKLVESLPPFSIEWNVLSQQLRSNIIILNVQVYIFRQKLITSSMSKTVDWFHESMKLERIEYRGCNLQSA